MPPANAAAISQVLSDISTFDPPLLTRSDQQQYLEKLTSTHNFTYYSSTYGHTVHDAASLRKVLANTMRHHPNPEFGTAGGNAAVDTLFQFGCEMLEPEYVDEVRLAAVQEVVERREEEEEESSEGEGEELLGGNMMGGGDSENDEDFVPTGRRLRKRAPSAQRKRKASTSSSEEGDVSAERPWRDSGRKPLKRRLAATTSALGERGREMKEVDGRRRSDVGEGIEASSHPQRDEKCGRNGAETAVDRREGCQRSSGLADSNPAQSELPSIHGTRVNVGQSDNVRLREAVERLNRRVHTAIVQLWDEIGSIA